MENIHSRPEPGPIAPTKPAAFDVLHQRCAAVVGEVLTDWEKSGLLARKSLRHLYLDKTEELVGQWSKDYARLASTDLSSAVIARRDLIRCYRSCIDSERAKALLLPESLRLLQEIVAELEASLPVATVIDGLRAHKLAVTAVRKGSLDKLDRSQLPSTSKEDFEALLTYVRTTIQTLEAGETFLFNVGSYEHEVQAYVESSADGESYRISFYDAATGVVERFSCADAESASAHKLWASRLADKVLYRGFLPDDPEAAPPIETDQSRPLTTSPQRKNTCGYQSLKFWTKDRFFERHINPELAEQEYKCFIALAGEEPLSDKHKAVDGATWQLCQQKQQSRSRYLLYSELQQDAALYATACTQAEKALQDLEAAVPERPSKPSAAHLETLYQTLLSHVSKQRIPCKRLSVWNHAASPLLQAAYQRHAQRERLHTASCTALKQLVSHEDSSAARLGRWVSKVSNRRIPVKKIEEALGLRTVSSEPALRRALETFDYSDEQLAEMADYFVQHPSVLEQSSLQQLSLAVLSQCLQRNLEEPKEALLNVIGEKKLRSRAAELFAQPIQNLVDAGNFAGAAALIRRYPHDDWAWSVSQIGSQDEELGRELLAVLVQESRNHRSASEPHLRYCYGLLKAGDTEQLVRLLRDQDFQARIANTGRKDIFRSWAMRLQESDNMEETKLFVTLLVEQLDQGAVSVFDRWLGEPIKEALAGKEDFDAKSLLRASVNYVHLSNVVEALLEWKQVDAKDVLTALPAASFESRDTLNCLSRWKLWGAITERCDKDLVGLSPDEGLQQALYWLRAAHNQKREAPQALIAYIERCGSAKGELGARYPALSDKVLDYLDELIRATWRGSDASFPRNALEILRDAGFPILEQEFVRSVQESEEDVYSMVKEAGLFTSEQLEQLKPPETG